MVPITAAISATGQSRANSIRRTPRLAGRCRALLALLFAVATTGAAAAPPLVVNSQHLSANLTPYLDVLEDPGGRLSAADVLRLPSASHFAPSKTTLLSLGVTHSVFWLRFSVDNRLDRPTPLLLSLLPPDLTDAELYRIDPDGPVPVARMGTAVGPGAQVPANKQLTVPITAAPHEMSHWLIRVSSVNRLLLEARLSSLSAWAAQTGVRHWAAGASLGCHALLVLLSLALWPIMRDRLFGVLAIYLASWLGFQLGIGGYLFRAFPSTVPWVRANLAVLVFIGFISALWMTYLLIARSPKRWDARLLQAAIVIVVIELVAMPWQSPDLTIGAAYVLGLAVAALIFVVTAAAYWREHNAVVLYYLFIKQFPALAAILTVLAAKLSMFDYETIATMLFASLLGEGVALLLLFLLRAVLIQRHELEQRQLESATQNRWLNRNTLLSRISHDIRTPLNGILGLAELLGTTPLSTGQRDYVRGITSSGRMLLNRINEVSDTARIEAGQISLLSLPFSVGEAVDECVDSFRYLSSEKKLEFVVDNRVPPRTVLIGDPNRVKQVMLNLLGHAFRNTEKGEVVLTVECTLDEGDATLELGIRDTGPGMTALQQRRVLHDGPLPERSDDNDNGDKLSLRYARRLAEIMGGAFTLQSHLGRGTTASARLPLRRRDTPGDNGRPSTDLHDRRLLIVDDNASCRTAVSQVTRSWGMQVTTARSGNEALAIFRSHSQLDAPFDLLLIDHHMPGMTGIELIGRLATASDHPLPPVIVMTDLTTPQIAPRGDDVSVQQWVIKPISSPALELIFKEVLRTDTAGGVPSPNAGKPARPRILVAEDNLISVQVISGMLDQLTVEYEVVHDGLEALQHIKQQPYDLVLMDCDMPEMDGFEATTLIRAWEDDQLRARTTIVALSALTFEELEARVRRSGMDDYLTKPIDLQQLKTLVDRVRFSRLRQG